MLSGENAYFDAAVMLAFFLLLGRYLDHRSRALARSAAEELAALEVPRAIVLQDGQEFLRPIAQVAKGDLVLVRPGGRMPVDGVVVQGTSEVDRGLLTGESLPAFAGPGLAVSAGEVNLTGPLTLRVTAAGRDSSLHRMADLVAVAESARNRYTTLAERAARIYSPLVHILSFSAFAFWLWKTGGDLRFAVNISAAVLIITCPCALGLAVPAVVTAASGKLFRKGVLIKNGTALERLAEVDVVVFDKTGTLTLGTPTPSNLESVSAQDQSVALALAKASSHPLAMALAGRISGAPAAVTDLREVPGYGIEGQLHGQTVRLGRAGWAGVEGLSQTATYLAIEGKAPVAFTFTDQIRPGAEAAIAGLTLQGKRIKLVSGDTEAAVRAFAARVGIADWVAGALPAEKAAIVRGLADQGHKVLMVGDGLNDTAALAAAHVSISPAQALDAARVASDIVLLGRDLSAIADATRIARQATKRMVENFQISAAYNVIAVPLALMGAATPLAAALAMSLSSITVSLNALRLR
jgi:Cu2+-exporting ATPase